MEVEHKVKYHIPGTICYIGTPDVNGRRNIRGEIDHVRIFYNGHVLYSVRYWEETNIKYCLCEKNEIYVEEKVAEQPMGFAGTSMDKKKIETTTKKEKNKT